MKLELLWSGTAPHVSTLCLPDVTAHGLITSVFANCKREQRLEVVTAREQGYGLSSLQENSQFSNDTNGCTQSFPWYGITIIEVVCCYASAAYKDPRSIATLIGLAGLPRSSFLA